jgi:hypothetical protein
VSRPKTHKIGLRTRGLTDTQAARLHYLVSSAARSLTEDYETASNVPVRVLRRLFPADDHDWYAVPAAERARLVT